MVPAAAVDSTIEELLPLLEKGDTIIDGGNSYYIDDIRRAKHIAPKGIHYVDVGTSGGVWGLERGYCMMIGGENEIVQRLDPIFRTLAPGIGDIPRTVGRPENQGTAELGYLHCGANGAGHFVKMVHNGIEYGIMAAYAEGMNILKNANIGKKLQTIDAETTPLRDPEHYQYDLNLTDISEVWRRGSVVAAGFSTSPPIPSSRIPTSKTSPAASATPAKGVGPSKPPSTKPFPSQCSQPPSTNALAPEAIPNSKTNSSPP
jgi:6-phosphogluconate dehydrogenase